MSPIVEAIRGMRAAPALWSQTTIGGVRYFAVGGRLGMVYAAGGRWWWRWNPTGRARSTLHLERAMLECQRAAVAWVLASGWTAKAKKRKSVPGPRSFSPQRAARASKLDAATIDKVLAEAPATIREVAEQLAPYVSP